MKNKFVHAGLGAFSAAALLGGALVPAAAIAAPGDYDDSVNAVNPEALSVIDDAKDGQASLTIHKYEQPETPTGLPNDGMPLKADALSALTALEGIKFKIQRVSDIDLKTQAGWERAAALGKQAKSEGAEAVAKTLSFDEAKEGLTAADGSLSFSSLPFGLYYVTEDLAGSTNPKAAQVTPAAPFFLTVPLTNTQQLNNWVYDVHTYPKNSFSEAEKSVQDDGAPAVGDTLTYTVKGNIPKLGTYEVEVDGEKVTKDYTLANYQIVDPLDARLGYVEDSVKVTLEGAEGVNLEKGTDWEVGVYKPEDGKTYVTVEFTEAGRAKLVAARNAGTAATKVVVKLDAVVNSLGADGNIPNTAVLIPNQPSNPWDKDRGPGQPGTPPPGIPTNTVVSKYGRVEINKVDSNDDTKKLQGAEFQVKRCKVANDAIDAMNVSPETAFRLDTPVEAMEESALEVGKKGADRKSTFVTAENGKVLIDGLQHNDWRNDSKETEGQIDLKDPASYGDYNAYCLIETKAPEGYELLAKPIPFLVTDRTMNGTENATLPVTIKNVKTNNGFNLPVTGGEGIALLVTAGGLLVAGGALVALRNRRNKAEA
ncbi:hypothetical protein BK816_00295 [Boudabousia tangfeifanii]|uniref:Gram-positive cocci surface proteins LPxTG domain-containing protein n=1 Tax=Boudabousia tangfeifanii TaxID=1912795 RepID=A0A1D9MHZ4_9ACTO|nr:SpaH/EbpB family LPXTG-anchored major pilin [Boudabousia tangfeifanii]AOZ71922.1 hypothetical protein BK816_00295 [Boudabousia tangfeifanii]